MYANGIPIYELNVEDLNLNIIFALGLLSSYLASPRRRAMFQDRQGIQCRWESCSNKQQQ
jgi:hypothetical protein